ncbi:MAG: c-type cytochrome [Gammaproteobacteria bacterium]|nr:c-type cytochrome [Gammaproteobacteria bacterium]
MSRRFKNMRASMRNIVWTGLAVIGLSACGGSDEPAAPADTASSAPAAAVEEMDLSQMLADADIKRGETLYFQCRACHTLDEGGANKVGPNLYGIFGNKAGQVPGFSYSDAVMNSDIVWTAETIDQWLEQPAEFLPGNMMVFVGVKDPQDRANLIAFLQANTGAAAE